MPPEDPLSEATIQYRKYHPVTENEKRFRAGLPLRKVEAPRNPDLIDKGVSIASEVVLNLFKILGALVILVVGVGALCACVVGLPIAVLGFAALPAGTLLGYLLLILVLERKL